MGNPQSDTTLFRIDHSRNMRRYYSADIQPNLFGGHSLIRTWGRIGSSGQVMIDFFDNEIEASAAQIKLLNQKRKRGYVYFSPFSAQCSRTLSIQLSNHTHEPL